MLVLRDWLKDYYGDDIPTLNEMENLFTFHAFEVEETKSDGGAEVIDLKILPDRAADCLSHRGIARELAVLTEKELSHDPFHAEVSLTPITNRITIGIENEKNCRRFALVLMTGVTIKESPEWLRNRLEVLGQRSINNVVDATNYVMLALGQPLHAYDAKKVTHDESGWSFGVRMAREGEEVTTLSGDTYTCKENVQLIVDGKNDIPLGFAGIKGGKAAEIDATTTDIIIEAANFDPQITRKGSQFLRLQTDASKRFENNISPEVVPYALHDVVALIGEIAGGVCEGYVDVYPHKEEGEQVKVTHTHVNALLGLTLEKQMISNILFRLGFAFEEREDEWDIRAPFERRDILIAEDIISEIGRVYGYEHVSPVLPEMVPLQEYNARHYYSEKVRTALLNEGFSEIVTSSFRKKDSIELQNALASDKRFMRSALRENIREVLDKNIPNVDLLGLQDIRVFEIGTVFYKNEDGTDVTEHVSLGIGVRTKQQGCTPKDDAILNDVKKILSETLGIQIGGTIENGIFECNVTSMLKHLPSPVSYDTFVPSRDIVFTPYSQYPFISRDIALWVPETTPASAVEDVIRTHAGNLLVRVSLFDEFKKDGKVSYAFRLIFQSMERTLTDEEVGTCMEQVIFALKNQGFEVR